MTHFLAVDDPLAVAAVEAIQRGDGPRLRGLLDTHPELAAARIGESAPGGTSGTLLHAVTDWPGHFPCGAETVRILVAAGADPNARFTGPHAEAPLHWAASADDVEVLDALLDAGAAIDADGAVIGGGTALTDATAFGQWTAAHRLLARGATAGFWESAALGLAEPVQAFLAAQPGPTPAEITEALWGAGHGGQRAIAELLLAAGADPNWVGWDGLTPQAAASRSGASELAEWLGSLGPARG